MASVVGALQQLHRGRRVRTSRNWARRACVSTWSWPALGGSRSPRTRSWPALGGSRSPRTWSWSALGGSRSPRTWSWPALGGSRSPRTHPYSHWLSQGSPPPCTHTQFIPRVHTLYSYLTSTGLSQASPLYGYWFRAVHDGKHYVSFYKVGGWAGSTYVRADMPSGSGNLVSAVAFSSAPLCSSHTVGAWGDLDRVRVSPSPSESIQLPSGN